MWIWLLMTTGGGAVIRRLNTESISVGEKGRNHNLPHLWKTKREVRSRGEDAEEKTEQ